MKKLLIVVFSLIAAFVISGPAFAGIVGSSHDFSDGDSTDSWNGSGEICITCHTPHAPMTGKPVMWNHTTDNGTYANDLTTGFGTAWGVPDAPSLLCLSCHDGTVALDSFGGTSGTQDIETVYGAGTSLKVGNGASLTGNHPVSIAYDDTVGGGSEFVDDAIVAGTAIKLYGSVGSYKVQCGSCHDVHNSADLAKGDGLLRIDNAGSALCLACHSK